MDGDLGRERLEWTLPRVVGAEAGAGSRRWTAHAAHAAVAGAVAGPHRVVRPWQDRRAEFRVMGSESEKTRGGPDTVRLDGSRGEGGGQILRTALTLSLSDRPAVPHGQDPGEPREARPAAPAQDGRRGGRRAGPGPRWSAPRSARASCRSRRPSTSRAT